MKGSCVCLVDALSKVKIVPNKPPKPCKSPKCSNLTYKNYCEKHSKFYEIDRGSSSERHYGSKWQAIRKGFLIAYPLCVECMKKGRPTEATEVHHIVPLRDGGTNDYSNLMALCKSCHSKHTSRDGGFGRNIVYTYRF